MPAGVAISTPDNGDLMVSQIRPWHLVWGALCSLAVIAIAGPTLLLALGFDVSLSSIIVTVLAIAIACTFLAGLGLIEVMGVATFCPQWALTQVRHLRWRRSDGSWHLAVGWRPLRRERKLPADSVRWLGLASAPPAPRQLDLVLVLATGESVKLLHGFRNEPQAMAVAQAISEATDIDVRDARGRVVQLRPSPS